MVIICKWGTQPIAITYRTAGLTLSIGHPEYVVSLDGAGRLWSVFQDGITIRRGLNGRMLAKRRNGQRIRRWLAPDEAQALEAKVHKTLGNLYNAIGAGSADLRAPLPTGAARIIEQALAFDAAADIAQYHRIYQPIGILPPDQYLAVVLQATEGCSFNTCTFCDFYKSQTFRVKSLMEFRDHAEAVREYLGSGLSLRRDVFLGAANALVLPMHKLLPLIDVAREVFGRGMVAFLDGFSGRKKSAADYAVLAERGLRRVYIGLESGSADVLTHLNKPGLPADAVEAVTALKAGGVSVSVIVLLGVGGAEHVRETVTVLNQMPLDKGDLLYFSDLIGERALPEAVYRQQEEVIRDGLRIKPHISRYDIREFIY